jgi:hypothetical protein|tara:strand:+ start:296 stop:646 length:351 start_codon:yes stop_codon:yes gene_type:complete
MTVKIIWLPICLALYLSYYLFCSFKTASENITLTDYFISNNDLIRATLDHNIESAALSINKDNNISKNYYWNIILELKYDVNLDNYVRSNSKNIGMRLSSNSKFVNSAFKAPFSYS